MPHQMITFVKAGVQLPRTTEIKNLPGILATEQDWQFSVDLVKQLKFPPYNITTTLRPDILLVSEVTKNIVMLELTVPWEDRL